MYGKYHSNVHKRSTEYIHSFALFSCGGVLFGLEGRLNPPDEESAKTVRFYEEVFCNVRTKLSISDSII